MNGAIESVGMSGAGLSGGMSAGADFSGMQASADGDASNRIGAAGGDFSNVVNIENAPKLSQDGLSGVESGASSGVEGAGGQGFEINQSSMSISSETNISISQSTTNITINFGQPEDAMDKLFDLFAGQGEDEKLVELMIALFEKQQEEIMELFQILLEATGMAGSVNVQA